MRLFPAGVTGPFELGDYLDSGCGIVTGAVVSNCGRYRYRLWRAWGSGQRMAWIMLNPSTADETADDPTVRRCMSFAQREGFDGIEVVNLYAYRSTDPQELADVYQVEGIDNARHWGDMLCDASIGMVVAAWGAWRPKVNGEVLRSRALEMLADTPVWCLGTTKSGAPRHPLYVRGDHPFTRYETDPDWESPRDREATW